MRLWICVALLSGCGGTLHATDGPDGPGSAAIDLAQVGDASSSFDGSSSVDMSTTGPDAAPTTGSGKVVIFDNFDDDTLPTAFAFGSQNGGTIELSSDPSQVYGGTGKSVHGHYPAADGTPVWGGIDLSKLNTENVYTRFRAKMPGVKFGLKFCKVFGGTSYAASDTSMANPQYANTTFGLDYTQGPTASGGMTYVGFGDGSGTAGDTANGVWLDGQNPDLAGRSYGLPGFSVSAPQMMSWDPSHWGDDWHLFELYVKFNSGTTSENEVNDGEILVKIDGVVWAEAHGLFNRNPVNLPIDNIGFFNWSQGATEAFDVWYDNIEISVDGWGDSPV